MDGTTNYEDMQITKVVAQYMNDEEWTDEIEVSDDRSASTVATQLGIEDQGYRLFLEANEVGEVFTVYMYSPFKVPANRIDATAKILNRINRTRLRLGRLAVLDNGEASPIQFACSIDVEGGALAPGQIGTIIGVCFHSVDFINCYPLWLLPKCQRTNCGRSSLRRKRGSLRNSKKTKILVKPAATTDRISYESETGS